MNHIIEGRGSGAPADAVRKPGRAFALGASLVGTGVTALVQLILIPVFVRLLGLEAYGLIGFYIALQGASQVLDLGLSPALSRELAGAQAHPESIASTRDLVRTVEVGYLVIGVGLGAALTGLAPWLTTHWFSGTALPSDTILLSLQLMGLLLMVQWPISLYQSALVGLEQLIGLNAINTVAALVINGGGVLFLMATTASLPRLLLWWVGANTVRTVVLALLVWRSLPLTDRKLRIDPSRLRAIARYAGGMAIGSAAGLLLTQLDRVAVSRALPLADLGRYSLAANVVIALSLIALATYNALFPRLAALSELGEAGPVANHFHLTAQIVVVVVVPVGLVLSLFATDVFTLWTGDAAQAHRIAPAAALLAAGSVLNALSIAPYALQLAARWTRLNAMLSLGLLVVALPLWVWLPEIAGLAGAAAVWLVVNALGLGVQSFATFRRLLPNERGRWFREDVAVPGGATLSLVAGVRIAADLISPQRAGLTALFVLVIAGVVALAVAFTTAPRPRRAIAQVLRTWGWI